MGTIIRTTVLALAGCAIAVSAAAQTPSLSLETTLYRSVCERVQAPMVFSTRDTAFALSLPADEPATISLRVTVGKNGKVRERLTRVDANHIAGYVAPAFVAATKDLRVDKSLLGGLTGKDTSILLTFPLEYQCVLDTVSKAMPEGDLSKRVALSFHSVNYKTGIPETVKEREKGIEGWIASYPGDIKERYKKSTPTPIWYYLAFIKEQPE